MAEPDEGPTLTAEHFHPHLRHRMEQRGITEEEVRDIVRRRGYSGDAKPGTHGRTLVFAHGAHWEGTYHEEKEMTVYFKVDDDELVLGIAIARYGSNFSRHPDVS